MPPGTIADDFYLFVFDTAEQKLILDILKNAYYSEIEECLSLLSEKDKEYADFLSTLSGTLDCTDKPQEIFRALNDFTEKNTEYWHPYWDREELFIRKIILALSAKCYRKIDFEFTVQPFDSSFHARPYNCDDMMHFFYSNGADLQQEPTVYLRLANMEDIAHLQDYIKQTLQGNGFINGEAIALGLISSDLEEILTNKPTYMSKLLPGRKPLPAERLVLTLAVEGA